MSNIKFRPIQGSDKQIQAIEYNDGYIYFATDTGKIYLDADNENKILMGGGGASLLYANDSSVDARPDDTYIISMDTLEDSSNLKENDLIINQANGSFYKVQSINADSNAVVCTLIAISGTGGGGGGSGGGGGNVGPDGTPLLTMEVSGIASRQTYVYGEPAYVTVTANAQLDATVTIIYDIVGQTDSTSFTSEIVSGSNGEKFDIGSKLFRGINKVTITAQTNNSGSDYRAYSNIEVVNMTLLPSNINTARVIGVDERSINVQVTGANLSKKVQGYIDNVPFYEKTVNNNASLEIVLPGAKFTGAVDNDKRQTHGYHEVKITMVADVRGQQIPVPDLVYEFAWVEPGNTNPIIWFGEKPDVITNYSVASVNYMVYDPTVDEGRSFEIELFKEGIKLPESPRIISYNSDKMLAWNISNYTIGLNEYSIARTGVRREFQFTAEADTSRDMEIINTNLYLSLDSKGRSNNEASYNRNKWSYTNSNGQEFIPVFNNFNWYNNGWIENDITNFSALRISNGAELEISTPDILKTSKLNDSLTFEFQFEIKNVQNYITMVNTSVGSGESTGEDKDNDGEIDTESIDTSTVRSDWNDIAFADFYAGGVGFAFGPSDFFMAGGSALAYGRYKSDTLINVSIVLNKDEGLIYLYINGIMSQVKKCDVSKGFSNNRSFIHFYPRNCDLDLYKIRIYKKALSYADIVHNVLADLKDVNTYDANQITTTDAYNNQIIDLILLESYNLTHPDNPSMPYAILKINDKEATKLPYIKGGKVSCDITFVNPALDRAYETGELATVAAQAGMSVEDYYTRHCPSFFKSQGQVDVQGTSSQGYPRRNYKLKCKPSKYGGKWVMNRGPFAPDAEGNSREKEITGMYLDNARKEPTFTWKADYMESSGTHNSGLTSYLKTLYTKHPLEDYYARETIKDVDDLRTTIYGFPMLVFEEKIDGSYEFIGKYNFNLDKDCPNVTGMEYEEPHPFVPGKKMSEVCECWEMCNNKGTRTAFKTLNYDEIVGEVTDEVTGETTIDYTLKLPEDIEYRYLAKGDDLEDLLDNPSPDNNVKALEYYKNIQDLAEWLYWLDTSPDPNAENALGAELESPVTIESVEYTHDTKEYRLARFNKEFRDHFDEEYMLVYFIITELLVLYDSRGKNMMLATWGPQKEGGNYIWYPIFYDVDTQLGIDNSGVPMWDYDVNPTEERKFSTPGSVIWNNLFATKFTQIKNKYADLRKTKLNYNNLNGYYDFDPNVSGSYAMKGVRPYVVYNADAFFKYLAPAKSEYGYTTTEGTTAYTDTYYYCAQGTRELQRELFLNNRFYYLDSKWQAGDFSYNNISASTMTRINANDDKNTSDTVWKNMSNLPDGYEYPNEHDTLSWFNITPFLNSYAGVYIDSSFISSGRVTRAGETSTVNLPSAVATNIINGPNDSQGQIVYLSGKKYTSSYGDLSRYYLNEIDLTNANKLTDLLLGSDVDGYKNDFLKADAKVVFDKTNGYPLLREVNFSRLDKYGVAVNLFKSEKLENFRALESGITELQVPEGVQLKVCYLPKTIDEINFTEAKQLTKIIKSYPYKHETTGWPEGLYIEGLTNKLSEINDPDTPSSDFATNIGVFYLDGGFLGTDAYKILKGLVDIKLRMSTDWMSDNSLNKKLSINALNMNWSPFKKLEAGTPYGDSDYYISTDKYTFESYSPSSTKEWEKNTLNGLVYEKEYEPSADYPITDLSLLDDLIDGYDGNFYGAVEGTLAYVSGNIYVNNSESNPIKEVDIQNKYLKKYPELTIHAAHTAPAITINYYEESEDGVITQWGPQKYSMPISADSPEWDEKLIPLEKQPIKNHYDFLGWSLKQNATEIDKKQPTDYTLEDVIAAAGSGNTSLTFWAVYRIHPYTFTFKNFDGSSLSENPEEAEHYTIQVNAQEYLYIPDIIPWRDDSKLGIEQTYKFQGWVLNEGNTDSNILDLTQLKATRDLTFFAYYGNPVSVYDVIHEEYFIKVGNTQEYNEGSAGYADSNFTTTGIVLGLARPVKGKITIPTKFKGETVIALNNSFCGPVAENQHEAGFGGDITYVFFESDSKVREFQNYCFADNKNLIQVRFPTSLRRLGHRCFYGCTALTLYNDIIGNNIASIGWQCFTRAFSSSSPVTILIDSSVQRLDPSAFGNMNTSSFISLGSANRLSKFDVDQTVEQGGTKAIFIAWLDSVAITLESYTEKRYTSADLTTMCEGGKVTITYANGDGQ